MTPHRIAITGMGVLSPVGSDAKSSFAALVEGRSGVRELPFAWPDSACVRIGADVKQFDPVPRLGAGAVLHARFVQLALAALREALADSAVLDSGYDRTRIATIFGTGEGGVEFWNDESVTLSRAGTAAATALRLRGATPNAAAEAIAAYAGAEGPCFAVVSACASGTHAIGEAVQLLRTRGADAVLCGGSEATLHPYVLASFQRMGALAGNNERPERASRPFDRERDGFVMGEGACVLVLERLEDAHRRGAHVYAEIIGYGSSADAFHTTRPEPSGRGFVACMRAALADAAVDLESVDYVNAHGTGTKFNDATETIALKATFGERARSLWISSTKSMTGHLLGASGAFETAMTALALQRGVVPPTINLEHADPYCDLDYVPACARERGIALALKNSFGFGGQNASLVLRAAS